MNEDRGDQIKVRRCYKHRDSSCLSLSVCSAYILLSRVMDRSISEASNFDGRGSGDKVCCYCRRLSRCVSILRTSIRHRLICNNSEMPLKVRILLQDSSCMYRTYCAVSPEPTCSSYNVILFMSIPLNYTKNITFPFKLYQLFLTLFYCLPFDWSIDRKSIFYFDY